MARHTDSRDACSCSCEHCWPSAANPHDDAGDPRFCPRGHNHTHEGAAHGNPDFDVDWNPTPERVARDFADSAV